MESWPETVNRWKALRPKTRRNFWWSMGVLVLAVFPGALLNVPIIVAFIGGAVGAAFAVAKGAKDDDPAAVGLAGFLLCLAVLFATSSAAGTIRDKVTLENERSENVQSRRELTKRVIELEKRLPAKPATSPKVPSPSGG